MDCMNKNQPHPNLHLTKKDERLKKSLVSNEVPQPARLSNLYRRLLEDFGFHQVVKGRLS